MNKRKIQKSCFVLEEENHIVVASLKDENDYSLQHTIHDMPHPRIRAPGSIKDKIEKDSVFMASLFHETIKGDGVIKF